jgi:hypothetical protein
VGAELRRGERGGVDGAESGQGTVGTLLDVGFYIQERSGNLAAGAGSEKEGGQREGYDGDGKMTHRGKGVGSILQIYSKIAANMTAGLLCTIFAKIWLQIKKFIYLQ